MNQAKFAALIHLFSNGNAARHVTIMKGALLNQTAIMTRSSTLRILVLGIVTMLPRSGFALVEAALNVNFNSAGLVETNLKTQSYLLFGNSYVALGPFVQWQSFNSDASETIIGGAIKGGGEFFLVLAGGSLQKQAYGLSANGVAATLTVGVKLTQVLQIVIPMTYRRYDDTSQLGFKEYADITPLCGVGISL